MRRKPLFPPVDPVTGKRPESKGWQRSGCMTRGGQVSFMRRRWRFAKVGNDTPADHWINAAGRTATLAVQGLCCLLSCDARSFQRTSEHLKESAGVSLSGETIRTIVEANGRMALDAAKAGRLQPVWKARQGSQQPAKAAGPLYAGMDGVMVPLVTQEEKRKGRLTARNKRRRRLRKMSREQKSKVRPLPRAKPGAQNPYHEFKIISFYSHDKKLRQVAATTGDHREAGRLLARDAQRLAFDQAQERVGVADGAPWIQRTFARQDIGIQAFILDFYHFSEHVHAATRAVFGEKPCPKENTRRPVDWQEQLEAREATGGQGQAHRIKTLAKEKGYDALWQELMEWRSRTRKSSSKKAIDQLTSYVACRRESLDYPTYVARGWDIGSGPTESMCKIIPWRVKASGHRWDADHAEEVMALECLEQSGQRAAFWRLQAAGVN